jgi:penicillin-binding protein 1A
MSNMYHGGPVDGGTFPADIWGTYMKSIIGGFCGPFNQPKEPFVSRPFFGQYSTTGGDRLGYGQREQDQSSPDKPTDKKPDNSNNDNGGNPSGGTQFDPDQYESPPQGPPDTGNGNGNR